MRAVKQRFKGYGSPTQTTYKRRKTSGGGVTSQYDRKTVYRKKSMPRRKRIQWKRFVKKTVAATMKQVGTRTIIRNNQTYQSWVTSAQQTLGFVLYGKSGTNNNAVLTGNADLTNIFANDPLLAKNTSKAYFGSAVMDITITNLSSLVAAGNDTTAVELDIYEIVFWKDPNLPTLESVYARADTNTDVINTGTSISLSIRGATPFDLPDGGAQGAKILKKTKYLLQGGEICTYQYRDAGNYSLNKDQVTDNSSFCLPKMTKGVLVIMKGCPTSLDTNVTKRIQIGCTTKYMYKVFVDNNDADNVI